MANLPAEDVFWNSIKNRRVWKKTWPVSSLYCSPPPRATSRNTYGYQHLVACRPEEGRYLISFQMTAVRKKLSRRKVTQLGMDSPFVSSSYAPLTTGRMGPLARLTGAHRNVDWTCAGPPKWHHCAWHPKNLVGNGEVRGFGAFQQCKRS